MYGDQLTIETSRAIGRERLDQLARASAGPEEDLLSRLCELPWIRFREVIDHPLDARGGFYPALLELVTLLETLAEERGPGIVGYFSRLDLNFSPRADASYRPESRVVSLSVGFMLFINELEATCRWLESIIFGERSALSVQEVARMEAPLDVRDELMALYHASDGGLRVSGKLGLTRPTGRMLLRFVLAHELGHLIDFAESPTLRASWRDTVWSDYQDALDYCLEIGAIDRIRYAGFLRGSLDEQVARNWATELLADGMGFYTMTRLPPPVGIDPRRARAVLQVAIELFFHAFVLACRGDTGTETHPPPLLRSYVARARRRKDHGASWTRFLSEHWAAGLITGELLLGTMSKLGARS